MLRCYITTEPKPGPAEPALRIDMRGQLSSHTHVDRSTPWSTHNSDPELRSGSTRQLLPSCRRLLLLRTRYNYSRTPPTHHAAAHETAVRCRARPLAPVAWATRTTAAKASPPLLLLLLLLPRPLLLPLPLPRLLLLLLMLSAQASNARCGQNHVIGHKSTMTEVDLDRGEVWNGATHAGGGLAG